MFDIKYRATREVRVRETKDNTYLTKGMVGYRIDERIDEQESGNQKVEKVRGEGNLL